LNKLTEQMRRTSAALAEAEKERQQAIKAAEGAKRAAEEALAAKREAEKAGNTAKLAALPKLEAPSPSGAFDGVWAVTRTGTGCSLPTNTFAVVVTNGDINAGRGKVTPAGGFKFEGRSRGSGRPMHYTGTLRGKSGSGTFHTEGGRCSGTFTALRK
jgi:hypothetical protein